MVISKKHTKSKIFEGNNNHKEKVFFRMIFLLIVTISILSFGVNNIIHNENDYINYENNLEIISHPVSSADPINCRVYLDSLSDYEVYHGDTVILQGHVEESNETHPWFPSYNRQVILIVDSVANTSASAYTNALGYFSISFIVETDFNIYSNVTIEANTTALELTTEVQNYLELDVDAIIDIQINNYMEPQLTYTSFPGQDNYYIDGRVYDTSGNPYSGTGFQMDFYFNGTYERQDIWVGWDGYFWFSCWLRSNYSYYTISYAGGDDLGGGSFQFNFNKIDGITFEFDELPEIGYISENDWPRITGRVVASNNASFPIRWSEFILEFNGDDFYFQTNDRGEFTIESFQILNGTPLGINEMRFYLTHYTHDWNWLGIDPSNMENFENIQTIEIREPTLWEGPGSINPTVVYIIVGAVIGVVGIFILQKWRLRVADEKDKKLTIAQVLEKFKHIRSLLDAGRIKEACAYLYIIYSEISETKYNRDKKLSQSLRGFAIMMVKEYGANPMTIYPFIQDVEKVIYGGFTPDVNSYTSIEKKFSKLYIELMGTQMPQY